MRAIQSTLILACFAFWFGGFGFYVSIVVPIGTEILGSARDQGVITQQVSFWLNVFGAIATAAMAWESIASWKNSPTSRRRWLLICVIFFGLMQGGLFYLHPILSEMFDVTELDISDEVKFYNLHRVYLWLSTFQWLVAWIWMIGYCFRTNPPDSLRA